MSVAVSECCLFVSHNCSNRVCRRVTPLGIRSGKKVLIVGGAGFIGSHLADELLAHGHHVRALDNLDSQVHGYNASRPSYLNRDVELIVGDVRDCMLTERALQGIDVVYHLAAAVGVGQSMLRLLATVRSILWVLLYSSRKSSRTRWNASSLHRA